MRAILLRFFRKSDGLHSADLSPDDYDMKAVNDRVYRAMERVGKTRADIAIMFGMNPATPMSLQPPGKIPRFSMQSFVKLSSFLGVSVRWMLTGEPENEVDFYIMQDTRDIGETGVPKLEKAGSLAHHGAAIVSGSHHSTVLVQSFAGMSDMEHELIQTLRSLPAKEKAEAMAYIFALEKEVLEKA